MSKMKLGDLLKIKHGFAFMSENYVAKSRYALVTLANISSSNNFQFNKAKTTYYGSDFPKKFILQENDLIMPLTEQVIGLFGNSAFVPKTLNFSFVLNQRVGKVIPKEGKADKLFIHYLLSTDGVREQLEYRASGTRQRNISPNDVYDVDVYVPDMHEQQRIGELFYSLERKVNTNNKINETLRQQASLLYDYWFTQFDFPDENGKPYKSSGGKMVWSVDLKREIPDGWSAQSMSDNELFEIIKPGVEDFVTKTYLATGDVIGTDISVGNIVEFATREGRANMQPKVNTVWFAKMKNSIKHLFLSQGMKPLIGKTILSTGFCGLQCKEQSFEYISSFIAHSNFETLKDTLAHGATQEAVNNNDLNNIYFAIPNDRVLSAFHEIAKPIYAQISKNICENQQLTSLRDWLLPMLMNGQATVAGEENLVLQVNQNNTTQNMAMTKDLNCG